MTGRMYPGGWALSAPILAFVGFNPTFLPQFVLGYLGMPDRYTAIPRSSGYCACPILDPLTQR